MSRSDALVGYPLFLNLQGQRCLVFGGGKVAARKIQALLKRGANVICISKDFCKPLKKWRANGTSLRLKESSLVLTPASGLRRLDGALRKDEWKGARLVVAATSDRDFNARVAQACRRLKIWVNVVDDPALCDFYVPAVVEKGPLQIAISTGGTSPLFARRLREELEKVIPSSAGRLLEKLGRIRRHR